MREFKTTTYGKWILAGEHAVLRGSPALAFPLLSRALTLKYTDSASGLDVRFEGAHGADYKLLFHGVLDSALERLNIKDQRRGEFTLISDLPVGAGLGASAALCGAVARWCLAKDWIQDDMLYDFACRLEDLFHGESSGVDLAVSLSGQGVRFVRGGPRVAIVPEWRPKFYLSYCGQRGMTSDCVNKVKQGFQTDLHRAEGLDLQMRRAVELSEEGLRNQANRSLLIEGLNLGRDCFERWDLCFGHLGEHLRQLTSLGAAAVKPTGSGGGGFALSLWDNEPPTGYGLIPTFEV